MVTPGIDTPGSAGEAAAGASEPPSEQDGKPSRGAAPSKQDRATAAPDESASSQKVEHGSPGDRVPDDEAARAIRGAPGVSREGVRPGQPDQASRQGFGRQRGEPQDQPPADVLDDQNIAGDKDFELQPPTP